MYRCLKCKAEFPVLETGELHLMRCNPRGILETPPQTLGFTDEWEKTGTYTNSKEVA